LYSGSIACKVIGGIAADTETLVVVGGHLPPDNTVLAALEDGFSTPLGVMDADTELRDAIRSRISTREDHDPDNTVEIQLPLVKYFLPSAKVVWLRVASSLVADKLGQVIHEAAVSLGRRVAVLGSTDLTHYGSNYGFSPRGKGANARVWVKEVNDKRFIDAALALETAHMVKYANNEYSACSAGAAAAAASFARALGVKQGILVEYRTSYDVHPFESFVGYAGISYH